MGLSTFVVLQKNGFPSPALSVKDINKGVALFIPIKIHLRGNFILQPEISYIQKGIGESTYDFFEIPVLFKYQFLFSEKHSLEVGLFPYGKIIFYNRAEIILSRPLISLTNVTFL
ncbi:MAG: hypothetical protein ACI94Y_002703 [Maribacter sp.]